ncbi:hypothetical protein KC926_02940 [Candidatus Kaiserbacteria bacterium]|nr:hypothetical protein [Candidatus Kaiserbacteria bacterium]
MSPELIAAVKERIEIGHSKESIENELKAAGYSEEAIKQVFVAIDTESSLGASVVEEGQGAADFSAEKSAAPTTKELTLPKAIDLISSGFNFAIKQTSLILWLFVPFTIVSVFDYLSKVNQEAGSAFFQVSAGAFSIFAAILYLLASCAVLYTVSNPDREVSVAESFSWAKQNVFGYFWVVILSMMVVLGGAIIFIVPAIIVSISMYFAQYVFASEGLKGMDALRRSRELVRDDWWRVAYKLSTVLMIGLLIFFTIGIVIGVTFGFLLDDELYSDLAIDVFSGAFNAVATVVGAYIAASIYRHLVAYKGSGYVASQDGARWQYWTLAFFAPFLIALLTVAIFQAKSTFENDWSQPVEQSTIEERLEAKNRAAELRLDGEI